MANICDYEVRVKGSEKAAIMIFQSMPCLDILCVTEDQPGYAICFKGDCKWSVDYDTYDTLDEEDKVDLSDMSYEEISQKAVEYMGYSLRAKSEAFKCSILVHSWSDESDFDYFDYYDCGKVIKQRRLEYNEDEPNVFDWDKTEFVGHEGEYDENANGEENSIRAMDSLIKHLGGSESGGEISREGKELLDKLANINIMDEQADEAEEEESENIDENGNEQEYDKYKWTFKNGKRINGDGWSVTIPDGYKKVRSILPMPDGNLRVFELIPSNEKNVETCSVRILPGEKSQSSVFSKYEFVHPKARAGMAAAFTGKYADAKVETEIRMFGYQVQKYPELYSTAWEDLAASIMVLDTGNNTYSFQCMIFTYGYDQMIRIQTSEVNDTQKYQLLESVKAFFHTFKLDEPDEKCPAAAKLESDEVYSELLNGKVEKFNDAIEQAVTEYGAATNGTMEACHKMVENDILTSYLPVCMKQLLIDGMEVKEYYLILAEKLVDRLIAGGAGKPKMKKVFKKLHELDQDITEIDYFSDKITVAETDNMTRIRKKFERLEIEKTEVS